MSEATTRPAPTLHRAWPLECVLVSSDDAEGLLAALEGAGALLGRGERTQWPIAARAITEEFGRGRLTVGLVVDSEKSLTEKLSFARRSIAAGVATIEEDGIFFRREPSSAVAEAIWLVGGAEAVRPRMFEAHALLLPGFVAAFDRVAAQSEDPGRVADFLFGPHEPEELAATTRARLALAAGRTMADWLSSILPPPARVLGGPGRSQPWLDSEKLDLDAFDGCDLAAVAAPSPRGWDDILAGLPQTSDTVLIHLGPGSCATTRHDVVSVHSEGPGGLGALLEGLARLAARGLPVDASALFDCRGVTLPGPEVNGKPRGTTVVFQPRSPRFDPKAVTLPARSVRAKAEAPASAPVLREAPRPAPAQPPADGRAEIVLEHLETMRSFLDQHQSAVRRFYETAATRPEQSPPRPGPMVHGVDELVPGERVTAWARYTVDDAVFLKQHTPNVSAVSCLDREAFGLPVMPLTFSMEALAETAALLAPERVVTGLEQLEAQRWMSFERGSVAARLTAEVVENDGSRMVAVARLVDAQDPRRIYLAGRVVLEDSYPPPVRSPGWTPPEALACDWSGHDVYPQRGFHGPLLQAITRVEQHGPEGMTGELTVLPRGGLFASSAEPAFQIDPVLLDSLGMGLGVWTWREAMNGVYPVPVRVGRLDLYGPPCPEGEALRMEVRVGRNSDGILAADLSAIRSDGSLHARFERWEDYVYRLPLPVHRLAADPFGQTVTTPVPSPAAGAGWDDLVIREFPALPNGFFAASEGIWERILAWFWLSPPERAEWFSMTDDAERRHAWLAQRAALKEAAREVLSSQGRRAGSYDVSIRSTEHGELSTDGVALAVAQSGRRILAAAGSAQRGRLGLGLEPASAHSEVRDAGFSPDESLRLRGVGSDWPARAWCAKAAVARALGTTLAHDPQALVLGEIEAAPGRIRLIPSGHWTRMPGVPDEIDVATAKSGEHVLAVCRI